MEMLELALVVRPWPDLFCVNYIDDLELDYTLRLLLLAGTNFSVLVVCCIWQVFILAFFNVFLIDYK